MTDESGIAMKQVTLAGEDADERVRPETFLWCFECGNFVLRSQRTSHPHELVEDRDVDDPDSNIDHGSNSDDDDEDDEPRHVADMYRVELVYERRYTVNLPAATESDAKCRAKELHRKGESTQSGGHHIHTTTTKRKAVYEDDDEVDDLPGWPW